MRGRVPLHRVPRPVARNLVDERVRRPDRQQGEAHADASEHQSLVPVKGVSHAPKLSKCEYHDEVEAREEAEAGLGVLCWVQGVGLGRGCESADGKADICPGDDLGIPEPARVDCRHSVVSSRTNVSVEMRRGNRAIL